MRDKKNKEDKETYKEKITKEYIEFKRRAFITFTSAIVSIFLLPYIRVFDTQIISGDVEIDISRFLDYIFLVLITYIILRIISHRIWSVKKDE